VHALHLNASPDAIRALCSQAMPMIHRLCSAKICIYADDYAPPHFHLRGPTRMHRSILRRSRSVRPVDFVDAIQRALPDCHPGCQCDLAPFECQAQTGLCAVMPNILAR